MYLISNQTVFMKYPVITFPLSSSSLGSCFLPLKGHHLRNTDIYQNI